MNLPQFSKEINEVIKNNIDFSSKTFYNNSVWKPNTSYNIGDIVKYNDLTLVCIENHISGNDFSNDSKYWEYKSKKEFY